MATKPLSLDLIEQGRYQQRLDRSVRNAARYLARYIEHFGQAAVGASYTLGFKVKLVVGDHGKVNIRTGRIIHTEPGEPGEETVAKALMYGEGQYDLFVPVAGSDRDPEQSKLFTDDGRAID